MSPVGDAVGATEQGIRDSLWHARRLLEDPRLSCSYAVARVREVLDAVRADLYCAELSAARERVLPELDGLRARAARPDAVAVREDLQGAIVPVQRLLDGSIPAESAEQLRARVRAETLDEVLKLLEARIPVEPAGSHATRRRDTIRGCVSAVRALASGRST